MKKKLAFGLGLDRDDEGSGETGNFASCVPGHEAQSAAANVDACVDGALLQSMTGALLEESRSFALVQKQAIAAPEYPQLVLTGGERARDSLLAKPKSSCFFLPNAPPSCARNLICPANQPPHAQPSSPLHSSQRTATALKHAIPSKFP